MTLIDKIRKKYNFKDLPSTVLKGYSNTITLNNYEFKVNNKNIYRFGVRLSELHDSSRKIENMFRLSLVDLEDMYSSDGVEIFSFEDEQRLFDFLDIVTK